MADEMGLESNDTNNDDDGDGDGDEEQRRSKGGSRGVAAEEFARSLS